jgi:hypothetical protein
MENFSSPRGTRFAVVETLDDKATAAADSTPAAEKAAANPSSDPATESTEQYLARFGPTRRC